MKNFRSRLLESSLLIGVSALATPAFAQAVPADSQEAKAADPANSTETPSAGEVVVTGSLVRNPNLTASAPVNVVSEKEIELKQSNVAEELVRELPGAVPSIGSAVNNGNGGASFVNLRGLGSNRNVVVIDGVRLVPAELNGRFDLNNIPLALIQRVDILTGGASTTYGADAVAGVVNFITKKDFSGLDANMSEQISEKGDGNVFRGDLTLGANFDDGRGNAVLSVGYQRSKPIYQGARDYGLFGLDSSTGAGGGSGTSVPSRFSLPGVGTRQVNDAGTAFQPTAAFTPFNFNPYNVYQTPFERYNIYGAARYEVSDAVEVYTRAIFSKNSVSTIIAPSGAFGVAIQLPLNNPYLTTSLRNSFCAANGIDAATCLAASNPALLPGNAAYREVTTNLSRRAVENGPRISKYDTTFFDYRAGLRGAITDSIKWDVWGAYGQSDNLQNISGYTLNSRFRQAVRANNTATCFDTTNNCVPVNVFGPAGSITAAQAAFLTANSAVKTSTSLGQAHAQISGDLGFSSPFANDGISFAVGGEYRKYKALQLSDSLAQGGDLGGAGGAAPNITGGFEVSEGFGEIIVPLVQDKPFFRELTAEGGIRYSHYKVNAANSPTSNTTTWKAGGTWSPVEQIKFRGNYSHAVRAPNIAELFSPVNTTLTNLADDPCAVFNNAGARIRANPTGELRAICLAQGATAANVDNIFVPTGGQANATGGGNLALKPEVSNSYTLGAVVKPIRNFSFTVDYFNIKITGAITSPAPNDALAACFGTTGTPAAGASTTAACTVIRRNPLTGGLDGDPATTKGLFLSLSNLGVLKTSGIDFAANFNQDLGFGQLALNGIFTYTKESKFQAVQGVGIDRDCIGYYSANCNPQSKYQANARATLTIDKVDISLAWRYFSKLRYEGTASDFAARGFTPSTATTIGNRYLFPYAVLAGAAPTNGGILPASAGPEAGKLADFNRISAKNYFDLTTRFAANEHFTLTLAVQNLLNKEPPLVGSAAGSTTYNSGNTFPSTYDAIGRRYVATARIRF